MSSVDLEAKIPNNVGLRDNKRLLHALEKWQPAFLEWWKNLGPIDFNKNDIYLRTAIGVGQGGWAHFDYVKMPDYRWGIFLAEPVPDRKIHFGDNLGQPVWSEVPGELRNRLRRLIVTQGDTEPASVEQQRYLGRTAPSLYDLRNLFQVNVEEARHLWAMVYLLQRYFGRDGREEAATLLERRSGNVDRPRILGAFNERTPDWLSFFMFTSFTDRDGKMQLEALAQSGFDPLSRTCRFMLTEEGHHMFVGKSGVERILKATCSAMQAAGIHDPNDVAAVRALRVIDLPAIQKKLNFHYSVTLDLFGSEISTNAANAFNAGIKGRFHEDRIDDDHQLGDATYRVLQHVDGRFEWIDAPALAAINARLRDDYIDDCAPLIRAWNKVIAAAGIAFELSLPHRAFHRKVGDFAQLAVTPAGDIIDAERWQQRETQWLPDATDLEYVASLMQPCLGVGRFAQWIAAPVSGVGGKPGDFEYVRLAS
jgi:benzoyl-CoA 2,3-epoxidase subunit B